MRVGRLALPVLILAASVAGAQGPAATTRPVWTPEERAARAAAINAILAFRADLRGDSTRIAACRLVAEVQDSSTGTWVDVSYRRLLVAPFVPQSIPASACSVYAFRQPGTRVLWLSSLTEVRRRGGFHEVRAGGGVAYEADFQLLDGPGYRQFERYELSPYSTGGQLRWRVVRYEMTGQEFTHEHSSSRGPP